MKKNCRKLVSMMLIISLLIAGCGAAKTEATPAKQEEQTQVAEAPAVEEPEAETTEEVEETAKEETVEAETPAEVEVTPATEAAQAAETVTTAEEETPYEIVVVFEDKEYVIEIIDEKTFDLKGQKGTSRFETPEPINSLPPGKYDFMEVGPYIQSAIINIYG